MHTASTAAPRPRDSSRRSRRTAKEEECTPETNVLRVERGADGRLFAVKNGKRTAVKVCRCFPWSEPNRFVSLRDEKDAEVALIDDLAVLDPSSRGVLELALAEVGFVLEIERIESCEDVFEIRNWKVKTKQGARTFQTALDAWPREVPRGGYLIKDISGDLYFVPNPEGMDEKSQSILWGLVD